MPAFYFDVGGVLIPDNFAPHNALETFRKLSKQHRLDPAVAYRIYGQVQTGLDLGSISLEQFCSHIGADRTEFERDWLAMHPVDPAVTAVIERLLVAGHPVGLATNFCRTLLDLLIENNRVLSRLSVCCSSEIGLVKPSHEFFDRANQMMPSGETVFIDDREVNVESARKFGWTAIHARPGWLSEFEKTYVA